MDWQVGLGADCGALVPHIAEPNPDSPHKSPKDRLVKLLDQVEMHVERLRKDALKLEEERDTLLTTLDTIRNSEMMIDLSDSKYGWFLNSFALF
jgi:BCL2-associated athanogene 2